MIVPSTYMCYDMAFSETEDSQGGKLEEQNVIIRHSAEIVVLPDRSRTECKLIGSLDER